jgi:regulator of RNase E activity RraA
MTRSIRTHVLSEEAIAKLKTVSTATITSQLNKRGLRNTFLAGIYPLRPDLRMVGYAFTLRYIPAREDLADELYDNTRNVQRLAVEAIGPDDVLVIDARSEVGWGATLGNILGTRLKVRGAAGIVTDGALRDTPGFKEIDLPTYIRAPHATSSFVVHHPAEMQVPVGCAGVAVIPGDVIVGDGEGVVVIPAKMAEEVAHDAYEQERREEFIQQKIAGGASILGVYPPDEKTLAEYKEWRNR